MVESNPNEGVLTNVVGTGNLTDARHAAEVKTMVMISADKAVNRLSVMGATKRSADLARRMICLAGPRSDVEYTGVCQGEKIHEELFHYSETPARTSRADVLPATSKPPDFDVPRRQLGELAAATAAEARRAAETPALIRRIVPA